jgi:hypothetical protein
LVYILARSTGHVNGVQFPVAVYCTRHSFLELDNKFSTFSFWYMKFEDASPSKKGEEKRYEFN